MGIFDMFVNQQKKTEEIMSKDLEKYVTASMQPIDSKFVVQKKHKKPFLANVLNIFCGLSIG